MPLLGICLSYYNDIECLKRLLKSIFPVPREYRDEVVLIAVDGRYRGFDPDKPRYPEHRKSTDGSFELIQQEQWKGEIRVINTVVPLTINEWEKRQKYVDIASMLGCDFIIIVDADEWFEVLCWKRLIEELQNRKGGRGNHVYRVHCIDVGNDFPQLRKRLWFKPQDMKYQDAHWKFDSHGAVFNFPSDILQIYHDPISCRSKERLDLRQDYESRLSSLESS